MTATLLDGKALAAKLHAENAERAARLNSERGIVACLAAVLVGDDPASNVYVRSKRKACERAGMTSQLHRLDASATTQDLLELVATLNADAQVHGILVQLPLPDQVDVTRVLDAVDPLKDVDGFHPENVGLLVQGRPRFVPCTPQGVVELLLRKGIETAGQRVVIVGRSEIVGKPLASLFLNKGPGGNATVTVCHSRTQHLAEITRQADILVAAIGRPQFITREMVQPGAVVIDVGINRAETGLVGDVDFDPVCEIASHITPVPGGVGPLTIAMVLQNTLQAAELQANKP